MHYYPGKFVTKFDTSVKRVAPWTGMDRPTAWGLLYGGGAQQLGVQALACVCVFAWVVALMGSMLKLLKWRGTLRVARDTELGGVDIVKHGAVAYPEFISQVDLEQAYEEPVAISRSTFHTLGTQSGGHRPA